MKMFSAILGFIFIIIAALATPVAIVYGIYLWAVADVLFKIALWGGAVVWMKMIACIIPGLVLLFLSN